MNNPFFVFWLLLIASIIIFYRKGVRHLSGMYMVIVYLKIQQTKKHRKKLIHSDVLSYIFT